MQGSISISRPRTQLNPITKGLAVLRKYGANAHLWLPGIGYVNGSDIGNYIDSTGNTKALVDNPVGLVLDQGCTPNSLGNNFIINSDFSQGSANWGLGTGWSATVGSATHASAGGASAITQGGLTIGTLYKATIYSVSPVGFNAVFGGNYISILWNGNIGTAYGICTSSTTFGLQGGGDITITKVTVQAVLGSLGPELAPQSFLNWTIYNTPVSVSSNSVVADAQADGLFFNGLNVGETYLVDFAGTTDTNVTLQQYGGSTIYLTNFGTAVFTAASTQFLLRFMAAGTYTATRMSVRKLNGLWATQATTANKPILRRGITNSLQYSGDFTNAVWTKANITTTSGIVDPYGGNSAIKLVSSATTNGMYVRQSGTFSFIGSTAYSVAAIVKADGFNQAYVMGYDGGGDRGAVFDLTTGNVTNAYSSPTQSSISLGNGWWLCVVNITPQATPTASLIDVRLAAGGTPGSVTGDGVKGIDVYRAALIQGTVTAKQIITCGGIPLTTTGITSSTLGNYAWQGNGTSTSLPLVGGSLAVNELTVVAGIMQASPAGSQLIYGEGTTGPQFWINSSGGLILDKSGTGTLVAQASIGQTGVAMVVSCKLQFGIAYLRRNGTQIGATSTALTFGSTSGSLMSTVSNTAWWSGMMYPIAVLPKGLPADDLLTVERFIGVFTGPTGVTF